MQSILSIAGLDPSSGAGICTDIKTARYLSFHACTAVTAITYQNTCGVLGINPVDNEVLSKQLNAVVDDILVSGIKIGMIPDKNASELIHQTVKKFDAPTVLDPVIKSTTGSNIGSLDSYRLLMPSCDVITPNTHEVEQLTGINITGVKSAKKAASHLSDSNSDSSDVSVAITGVNGKDVVFDASKEKMYVLGKKLEVGQVHGTGCVYSTALTCHLTSGLDLFTACKKSRRLVISAARRAVKIGECLPVVNL